MQQPWEVLVKENATVGDTLNLISSAIRNYYQSPFVLQKVKELNPTGDKYHFMKRLFDDVCKKVKYVLDPEGHEKVYTPERTYREGKGDCKKMTVAIASVLKAAGIEPYLKHVYYTNGENWTHIYVVVPLGDGYVTLDPVNDCKFDTEVEHSKETIFDINGKIIKDMNLSMMGAKPGVKQVQPTIKPKGNNCPCPVDKKGSSGSLMAGISLGCKFIDADLTSISKGVSSIGASEREAIYNEVFSDLLNEDIQISGVLQNIANGVKKAVSTVTTTVKKAVTNVVSTVADKFKTVSLALPRGAFLLLVDLNAFKLADKLVKAWGNNRNEVTTFWDKWGGDINELKKAIVKGSKQQISGRNVPMPRVVQVQGMGVTVAAAIATATPVVLAAVTMLKKLGVIKEGDELQTAAAQGAKDVAEGIIDPATFPKSDDTGKDLPPPPLPPTAGSFAFTMPTTIVEWIGTIVVKGSLYYSVFTGIHGPVLGTIIFTGAVGYMFFKSRKKKLA